MVTIPPPFTPDVINEPANYGVLEQLEGTWVNYNPDNNKTGWGLHTTCMPSPGTNSETVPGKFHFLCENYTEVMTFSLIPGGVRNRGGTNEQFCGAVRYDQNINRVDDDGKTAEGLHAEDGMYLWLDQIYNHPADDESIETDIGFPELSSGAGANGPVFIPSYSITRSGTIPHGSTAHLFGKHSDVTGKPEFPSGTATWDPAHLAISNSMGLAGTREDGPIDLDKRAPAWVHDPSLPARDPSGNKTYTQRILAHELYPYSVRPDLRLRDHIKDQQIKDYVLIHLDTLQPTGPQGCVSNNPFVQKYVPVTRMQLRLWIQTLIEDGKEVLQLQYEQIQDFQFHFGTDGGITLWPHIQINTLRKKEDVVG